ncbi:type 2 isopentenyl-diphosphate Delta-isomerase [Paenibacillus sp. PvR098]|uniref:type 2 isopentenyl-diphosphate Delta-isomerase n=1 Tax=unclassified Paenibacillus TaxID=185978 RepID=UPI001B523DBF|nr:isopentenyl-diphosphate delta-isomerase [Paenibacillus sp. PvP091]MBP1169374.1 isopentenyl-diphosphate delta-isomerase [Paenibacillus sp. PvR098]MBP2440402.1 isopentenyl-diphosphate delta-isomerase [Paenibacillus sp. PvP052]
MRIPRKMEHVHHALQLGQSGEHGFRDVKLIHNCLPGISSDQISLETAIGELNLSSPIVINAMTGGAHETEEINRELAVAARETGLAMAVGSQMSAIKNPEVESSYRIVRNVNPRGVVFGNLGSEATLEQALRAVDMLQADALQIHLNVMQELIMPEGDRDFNGMLDRVQTIVERVGVPVMVKEVGFGMVKESAEALFRCGVRIIDVGGAGGTNFAAIENARRNVPMEWLNDWGCKTTTSLLEVLEAKKHNHGAVFIVATGGISRAFDICKALTLGASAVGMAGSLLKVLREHGTEALTTHILSLHEELRLLMTAMGAKRVERLREMPVVITGETAEWCAARGIELGSYAIRAGYQKL